MVHGSYGLPWSGLYQNRKRKRTSKRLDCPEIRPLREQRLRSTQRPNLWVISAFTFRFAVFGISRFIIIKTSNH